MQCSCQILFLLCLELGRHRWKALSFVGTSLALKIFCRRTLVTLKMKFYEKQLDDNQWFASCRLLALALARSLLGFLLPLSVVPGNLAKLVVDIHQFRANHSNRFLGILRDTPLQYNTVYCLVSCDIFYIMLHKQNYFFVQFNSKKVNVCFLFLS